MAVAWLVYKYAPPNFTHFRCDFSRRCSCTNKWKACHQPVPPLCSRDTTDTTIRKNSEATITCPKKEKNAQAFPVCLHKRSTCDVKFPIESHKIEMGIAVTPLVLITTCSTVSYLFNVLARLLVIPLIS